MARLCVAEQGTAWQGSALRGVAGKHSRGTPGVRGPSLSCPLLTVTVTWWPRVLPLLARPACAGGAGVNVGLGQPVGDAEPAALVDDPPRVLVADQP